MHNRMISALIGLLSLFALPCLADDSATDYDIVTVQVTTSSYDASKPPVFARVKYNKLCPLVITSDDMGRVEFVRNWAFFNGYPVIASAYFYTMDDVSSLLNAPYNAATMSSAQEPELKADSFTPLTYTDGTGGVRRFTATSAIMPYKVEQKNYIWMHSTHAQAMVRTGWSFAQHDVADEKPDGVSTDAQWRSYITEQLPIQSQKMEDITGYGLKVIVEPNGDHQYIGAGIASNEVCWNIFQNASTEYPAQDATLSDWTGGSMPTDFTSKPTGAWERFFFQDKERTFYDEKIKPAIENNDGSKMILGGTHGIANAMLTILKEKVQPADKLWVAGADEVWEYYYIYNHAKIEDINYNDTEGKLTFTVKVPKYKKHQFRELTINIPGITDGTDCSFSDNVVTGGYRQNDDQYTINLGLETNTYTHIEELISFYRANLFNEYVKRDAQYLIDMLVPGAKKTAYSSQLNAMPNYQYKVEAILKGSGDAGADKKQTLFEGKSDVAEQQNISYPRYILDGSTLYETPANSSTPSYMLQFTPAETEDTETHSINYTAGQTGVVFYAEGETLDGVSPITDVISATKKGTGDPYHALMQASNGIGAHITTKTTVTTLASGIYTLTAGVGDTWHDATHYATLTFKLDDKVVYTFQTDAAGLKEYSQSDIIVKTGGTLTVEAEGTGNARWLDYVFVQKTAEYDASTPDVSLTATNDGIIKVSNGDTSVTLTASATPADGKSISKTVIKDEQGKIVATAEGSTCTYTFKNTVLGRYKFSAEATDDTKLTGVSDELTVSVTSDLSYSAYSSLGDLLAEESLSDQTATTSITYSYPRYLLKGTELYETQPRNSGKAIHYGETFELKEPNIEKTISYERSKENVVFYTEGEAISGVNIRTDAASGNQDTGAPYWALIYGSNGAGADLKDKKLTLTTLPAGTYKIYAGLGVTWTAKKATYTFTAGGEKIATMTTTTTEGVTELSGDSFTLNEETTLYVASESEHDKACWLDYVYIQKLDGVPVSITDAGYATFSSPYALDFTGSDIKAYVARMDGDVVTMTPIEKVPAATGLFLQGTEGTAVSLTIPLASETQAVSGNALKPQLTTGTVGAGNYVFSGKDGQQLAFRRLTQATSLPAGRAYLQATAADGAPRLLQIQLEDGVTGLLPVTATQGTATDRPVYDLRGLPVGKSHKGIVIRNGKKSYQK